MNINRSWIRVVFRYSLPGIVFLVLIAVLLSGCGTGIGYDRDTNPAPPSPQRSTWTVLVYMCSENNLQNYGYLDVKEMERVGSTADMKVVVQWDRPKAGNKVDWGGCRRYLIKKDHTSSQEVQSQLLQTMGDVNMGDPDTLTNFINWGIRRYPADKYMLVLWNHGNGWKGHSAPQVSARGIAYDDGSGDYLTMEELRYALERSELTDSSKFELISMDACLMGTVEVAYDMKDFAKYLVFSSANVPLDGLPYDAILRNLAENPDMTGAEFGESIVREYGISYAHHPGVTQSVIDLSKITELVEKFNVMIDNVMVRSSNTQDNLFICAFRAMPLDGEHSDYRDFGDFLNIAALDMEDPEDPDMQANTIAVKALLNEVVIAEFHGINFPYATGLSIWVPQTKNKFDRLINTYRTTLFAQDTQWDVLLENVLNSQ
jgi:hypothetical protein